MMRLIFSSIMVLHALLHQIGFVYQLNIEAQDSQKHISGLFGKYLTIDSLFWLTACLLFITASVLYLMGREWFWISAVLAVAISQIMIIIHWQDSRYGTILNVVISVAVIFAASALHFKEMVKREVSVLLNESVTKQKLITEETIAHLPQNVQRWMRKSNVVGRNSPYAIRIIQEGSMKTKPAGKWMDFQAVQYFSIDPPSFVWDARIQAAPFITIAGRDKYHQGHGNMLIKPLYAITAANGSGKEINEGTLLRFLAEMAWFPQAAPSPYLKWEAVTDLQAQVTMTYEGVSASGIYTFNEDGHVTAFEAMRYGDFGGTYRKEPWSVVVTGYKSFDGSPVGYKSEVTWKLKEGDFTWLKMEVTDIRQAPMF